MPFLTVGVAMRIDATGVRVVIRGRYVVCGDRVGIVTRTLKGLAVVRWQGDVTPTLVRSRLLSVLDGPTLDPRAVAGMDSTMCAL